MRYEKGRHIPIRRFIVKTRLLVNHKNGDCLDNRRENLRPASSSDNGANMRKHRGGPSTREFQSPAITGASRYRHFKPLLKKAELPDIWLYDLRHTTAGLLLSVGENPKVVSEMLRHASIVLTLDTYSHALPTMQKSATNKLEKMMFGT
jgi:integrase